MENAETEEQETTDNELDTHGHLDRERKKARDRKIVIKKDRKYDRQKER